jgi:putative tryptophan/tyrosine transport system substrate-binding protein
VTTRRAFIGTLAGGLLAVPLAAGAQSAKAPRVGLLGLGSAESSSPLFEALRQGLRERGWVEGQNIAFEDRTTVGNYSRLPDVAAELVRLKVDVIVTWGTTPALAARKVTGTIPIVTTAGNDPVEMGLAASLARPGGNVTGLTSSGRELVGKRIELLKEALPRLSRIAVLWNPESRTQPLQLRDAEAAAKSLGLQVRSAEVRRPEDLEKVFASMVHERPGALVLAQSNMFRAHRARIVGLAARHRQNRSLHHLCRNTIWQVLGRDMCDPLDRGTRTKNGQSVSHQTQREPVFQSRLRFRFGNPVQLDRWVNTPRYCRPTKTRLRSGRRTERLDRGEVTSKKEGA